MIEKRRGFEGWVEYRCIVCGKWYRARERRYKHTCSDECSMERMRESIAQLRAKSGDIYDKWADHTAAGLRRVLADLQGGE